MRDNLIIPLIATIIGGIILLFIEYYVLPNYPQAENIPIFGVPLQVLRLIRKRWRRLVVLVIVLATGLFGFNLAFGDWLHAGLAVWGVVSLLTATYLVISLKTEIERPTTTKYDQEVYMANIDWRYISHPSGIAAITAIEGKLFAATKDNRLVKGDPNASEISWEDLGHAQNVGGMTAIRGKLYVTTPVNNKLWRRDPVGGNISWDHIGPANGITAMTAINDKIFGASPDCRFWMCDPFASNISWEQIGHTGYVVVTMTRIHGKLFAITQDAKFLMREPVPYDIPWKPVGYHADSIVAMTAINNRIFAAREGRESPKMREGPDPLTAPSRWKS